MLTIGDLIAIVSLCATLFGLGYKCNEFSLHSFENLAVALIGKSHRDKK